MILATARRFDIARARRNEGEVTQTRVAELYQECNQLYPPVKTGISILTFGAAGVTRAKQREECFAAARKGQDDPRTSITMNATALWRSAEPWTSRRTDDVGTARYFATYLNLPGAKTGGSVLNAMAKGFKPYPVAKFQDLERKATIIGGISALSVLGVFPYNEIPVDVLPSLKLQNDTNLANLMLRCRFIGVRQGIGDSQFRTATDCAEFIRREVIKHTAEELAWYYRALALTLAGETATDSRAAVEGGVKSTCDSIANYKIPVVSIIARVVSYKMAEDESRSQIENAQLNNEVLRYKAEIQQSLARYNIEQLQSTVDAQIEQAKKIRSELAVQAQANGELIGKFLVGGIVTGTVGGVVLLTAVVVKVARRRRKKRRTS